MGRPETFSTFGDLLKYLRIRAQLSQRDLAIAVGYSEAQISRLESNKRAPNQGVIQALFIPALRIEDEPELAARLLALAETVQDSRVLEYVPDLLHESASQLGIPKKRHNLPAELTSLVGREGDLAEIASLLDLTTTRLLTLTGSGGCGKTRLALRTAFNLVEHYPHGAWLVELAPLSEGSLVTQVVINMFGLLIDPNRLPIDTLVDFLNERECLLILDNCEHLIDAVSALVLALLRACPRLIILATSREALDVPGEVIFHVPSLDVPPLDWDGAPEAFASSRLFMERAAIAQPDFVRLEIDASVLARICRRLDGIPLAIELAAARVSALPLSLIADRLEEGFAVLGSGGRGRVPRQATLQATVEWSYNLLTGAEQALLCRLPLFAGGWMLEQAEEVCTCSVVERDAVLDLLVALVSKSLVAAERLSDGAMRYRLHEIVRQYAYERLVKAGEEETLRHCFLDCYIHLAEQAEPELKGPRQMEWLDRLDQERDNFNQALNLAVSFQDALSAQRLCGALAFYWIYRNRGDEGYRWLKTSLAMTDGTEYALDERNATISFEILSARAKTLAGVLWYPLFGFHPAEDELAYECERIYLVLNDLRGVTYARLLLARPDDLKVRMEQVRASLPFFLSQGDKWSAALVLFRLWDWERMDGNLEAAKTCLEQCITYLRSLGDRLFLADALLDSVWLEWDCGNIRGALEKCAEALDQFNAMKYLSQTPTALFYSTLFSAALGDFSVVNENFARGKEFIVTTGSYWRLPYYYAALARFYFFEGRLVEAQNVLEYSLAYIKKDYLDMDTWEVLQYYGLVMLHQNQLEHSAAMLEHSLAIAERKIHHIYLNGPQRALGRVRLAQGDLPAARELFDHSMAELIRNRTLPDFPEMLECMASLLNVEGMDEKAAVLLGISDGLLARMEMVRYPVYQPEYTRCREAVRAVLGDIKFTQAYSTGMEQGSGPSPIESIKGILQSD